MFMLSSTFQKQTLDNLFRQYPHLDIAAAGTCAAYFQCMNQINDAHGVFLARYGLSTGRFTVLAILFAHRDQVITPSECANLTGVTRATMTGLLDGLERDGLIHREASQVDRRTVAVQLTEKSLKLLQEVMPDYFHRTTALVKDLTEIECLLLTALVAKISGNIHILLDP
jgi:DNA-binding MarR family transcriptional regulator